MNRRILPCLTWSGGDIVKTRQFSDAAYVGDIFNLVRVFSEKEADELIFLDIDATREGRGPDLGLVNDVAEGCTVPLSYGGGITTTAQIAEIIYRGVEKVVIGSGARANPNLVCEAAGAFGSSTITVCIDYMTNASAWRSGAKGRRILLQEEALQFAKAMEEAGAGELILHAADLDGTGSGYDIDFLRKVASRVSVPVIALGGAKGPEDFSAVFATTAVSAAASGTAMIYYGPHRAVLPSYSKLNDARSAMPTVAHDF